jgi:hypothetical protein
MNVSLFSRFQGCLLLTFLAPGDGGLVNEKAIITRLNQWSTMFHPHPYQGPLPTTVWQGEDLPWQGLEDFCRWLGVLALWHHENAAGFRTDLRRSAARLSRQFPDRPLSPLDLAWLQIWQRLLTLILSERFTPAQLPDLWRSPYLINSLDRRDALAQSCHRDLTAIAVALENDQAPCFTPSYPTQFSLTQGIPQAIYDWAVTPAQPRLNLLRSQGKPDAARIVPFTAALTGAYNGETISHQALGSSQFFPIQLVSLINHFAHHHYQSWSGGLSTSSPPPTLASAAPLVMQRRSALELISQQDYAQFS